METKHLSSRIKRPEIKSVEERDHKKQTVTAGRTGSNYKQKQDSDETRHGIEQRYGRDMQSLDETLIEALIDAMNKKNNNNQPDII